MSTSRSINPDPVPRLRQPKPLPLDPPQKSPTHGPTTVAESLGIWHRFKTLLSTRVSGTSLAVFRIALGCVMLLEAFSLCRPSQSSAGRIPLEVYYTGRDITFNFPYEGFGWLPFFSPLGIHIVVGLLVLGAFSLALGFLTRTSAFLTFLTWGYLYALESTRTYWMSYHYLELLSLFLILWMPTNRCYSLDARRKLKRDTGTGNDSDSNTSIPFWPLLLLRGQLVIAYFYAGVAKVNSDWLLDAMPVRWYLARSKALEMGIPTSWIHSDFLAYFISTTGALFDLSVGFLLLFRRTRIFALALLVVFHTTNHFFIFDDIGWFPLLGLVTATIFLYPDWPERVRSWLHNPRFKQPDRRWLWTGGLAFLGVGATLGWKLPPTSTPSSPTTTPIAACVAPLVIAWLALQTLVPLRHHLIPGDARITWEGLRFSWRLKAEVYRSGPLDLSIHDPAIVSKNSTDQVTINWQNWPSEHVLYEKLEPNTVDWSQLPEILVLWDSLIGERILFNPLAGNIPIESERDALNRVREIWQSVYQRQPASLHRTIPLNTIVDGYASAVRQKGLRLDPNADVFATLHRVHGAAGDGQMLPMLRRMHPFAIQHSAPVTAPFIFIDDPVLSQDPPTRPQQVDRRLWQTGPQTQAKADANIVHLDGDPIVIYSSDIKTETWMQLPKAFMVKSKSEFDGRPYVHWNYLKDIPMSKGLHISTQPFLLRLYARRMATLWEEELGRRPAVHAHTEVSLNGRPAQLLVDPMADLASVETRWMRRNEWIRDLETSRIPSESYDVHAPFQRVQTANTSP